MSLPKVYSNELENAIFQHGENGGRIVTCLSILTDSLLSLNSLEIFYQKPISKSVSPSEIIEIRTLIESVKVLLQETIKN